MNKKQFTFRFDQWYQIEVKSYIWKEEKRGFDLITYQERSSSRQLEPTSSIYSFSRHKTILTAIDELGSYGESKLLPLMSSTNWNTQSSSSSTTSNFSFDLGSSSTTGNGLNHRLHQAPNTTTTATIITIATDFCWFLFFDLGVWFFHRCKFPSPCWFTYIMFWVFLFHLGLIFWWNVRKKKTSLIYR